MENHEAKIAVSKQSTEAKPSAATMTMASAAADVVAIVIFVGETPGVAIMEVWMGHQASERVSI
jgi:hypothetical protein